MESLDSSLVWLRSIARAKHQGLSKICKVTFNEDSYLPGPLEGDFLKPELMQIEWRDDEKTAWAERGPYPFKEVGIELEAHLCFVLKGWRHRHPSRRRGRGPTRSESGDNER